MGGNHFEELGYERISRARHLPIPNPAATAPDLAGKHFDMRSSEPNQAICTPAFSYVLISSIVIPSSSSFSLPRPQLSHHRRTQS